jgi:DNA polymerase
MPQLFEAAAGKPNVIKALELRSKSSKTSVKKYDAMLSMASDVDARARGLFKYLGASRTGRYSGSGIQLQNLKRNNIEPLDIARELALAGDSSAMELMFGDVSDALSQLVRTALVSPTTFSVSDYSAIEARVLAWLADETWAIRAFENGRDLYIETYAQMSHKPYDNVTKDERAKGKIAVLACGYGGSVGALAAFGAESFMTETEMKETISDWRMANANIVKYWRVVDRAAKKAVLTGAKTRLKHGIEIGYSASFLYITLPSGRRLMYYKPTIGEGMFGNTEIRFRGTNQTTGKFEEQSTRGAKMVENITQAVARDLLAHALVRAEEAGLRTVMHVHDEIVIEGADLDKLNEIMVDKPKWADGLPLDAEGYKSKYYRK